MKEIIPLMQNHCAVKLVKSKDGLLIIKSKLAKSNKFLTMINTQLSSKPEIKVVYYLGMLTGQRLKDCVLLRWNKVDLR